MSTTTQEPLDVETEETTPEPEEKDKPGTSEREYVVLEQVSKGGPWNEIKRVTATDVSGALNSLGDKSKQTSSYVAVAERYWRPLSPQVETQTTITWK